MLTMETVKLYKYIKTNKILSFYKILLLLVTTYYYNDLSTSIHNIYYKFLIVKYYQTLNKNYGVN
jgi:hypothetical protein